MKKAIVVGATSGIGRGIAKVLSENNYRVGISGRRTNLLEEIRSENPLQYIIKTLDITETTDITAKLLQLVHELGGLDLLIISSGTGDINEKLDFEIEKRTIDTNVTGFTVVADWSFNYFKQQKFGQLVAITSIGGIRGNRQAPSYSASKAYQINYLEGLRHKAVKLKCPVYITDIRPGFVDTNMAKGDGLFWVSTVDKVSKQIFRGIQTKRKVVYVSKRWRLIAIFFKIMPSWIYDKM
jgi:short-subunit dehydrogenase